MSKVRSQWVEQGDTYVFTGDIEVPTPSLAPQAVNKAYVDAIVQGVSTFISDDLFYTDTSNLVIQLSNLPNTFSQVAVAAIGGTELDYGTEFTVRFIGTTAFICLDPASTPPGGGPFDGGDTNNPSIGITNILSQNDKINASYSSTGLGGSPPGFQGIEGPQGSFGGPQGNDGPMGVQGVQGPMALNPGITADLTGTSTDSYVTAYSFDSANGGIAAISAEIINTDPTNSLGFQQRATYIDGTFAENIPHDITPVTDNIWNVGGSDLNAHGDGNAYLNYSIDVKSTTSGQPATYSIYVRGVEVNAAGPQGVMGFQGEPGATGATGNMGSTGAKGFQGNTGATGATGAMGVQGRVGVQGSTGNPGANGPVGIQGYTGPQGFTGLTGSTGNAGVQGVTGANGVQGVNGSTGSTGSTGVQGSRGTTNIFTISYDTFNQVPGARSQSTTAPPIASMLTNIIGSTSVPANSLVVNDVYEYEFYGVCGGNTGGTAVPTLALVLGNTPYTSQTLAGATVDVSTAPSVLVKFKFRGQILIGALGGVFVSEIDNSYEFTAYPTTSGALITPSGSCVSNFAAKHVNTATSNNWDLIVTWGSGTSNSISINGGYLRKIT